VTGCIVGFLAGSALGLIIGVVMTLAAALILFSYRPEAEPEKLPRLQKNLVDCEKHIRFAETPIESTFDADFKHFGVSSLAELKDYNKAQWQRVLAIAPWDSKQLSSFVAMFAESR
jgi:hypothetical protein